jgi:hypothetical protein
VTHKNTLHLKTGQTLHLRALNQSLAYEGMMAGVPTRETNQDRIKRLMAKARELLDGCEPYLIAPPARPIGDDPRPKFARRSPAELLPGVACIGRFLAQEPASDPTKDISQLVVVWFQDEFAFPIAPSVVEQLQELDWKRFAFGFDY